MESVEFIVPPIIPPPFGEGAEEWLSLHHSMLGVEGWTPTEEVITKENGEGVRMHPLHFRVRHSQSLCNLRWDICTGDVMLLDWQDRIIPPELAKVVAQRIEAFYYTDATEENRLASNEDCTEYSEFIDYFEHDEEPKNTQPGIVYLIHGEHGFFKIGKTENLTDRLRALSTASPYELRVILEFHVNHMGRLEQYLQKRYASRRVRGEWFGLTYEDVSELYSLHRMLMTPTQMPPVPFPKF